MDTRSRGRFYEERAAQIVEKAGYRVVERNYQTARGEIDLIARKGKEVLFVEVKYRRTKRYGYGFEAVDRQKLRRIFFVMQDYLWKNREGDLELRMDCISFLGEEYTWYKDITRGDEIGCEMF